MELTTKFNINEQVWFLHPQSQRAVQGTIVGIQIRIGSQPQYIRSNDGKKGLIKTGQYKEQKFVNIYTIDDNIRKEGVSKAEYDIYYTKDQLIEKLKM